ncbi:type 2 lanthipeptide synthetase LanM [Yersinia enterocolitica]|uniref:type 2 lanthipeptide synthetase LanM n=1 Tax=Yersinia enterocolitica TaxID=630 RepID=UPI00094BAB80|nr:type 2 lanthipeptide synthetase LanM [Yersinia enterocolitica]
MLKTEKTLNTLLKKYPNADEILEKVGYVKLEDINTSLPIYEKDDTDAEVIKYLSSVINDHSITDNIYPILMDSLSLYFFEKIKKSICNFESIIHDIDKLSESLAKQGVNSLSSAVKKLCFLCVRLNQSEKHRIQNWSDMFSSYPVIKQKIQIHEFHVLKTIEDTLFKIQKDKAILQRNFNLKEFYIMSLALFLGDFHHSGQSVVKVNFVDGALIYKPRDAITEVLLSKILIDLFECKKDIKIGIPECITMDNYSWHEYIDFTTPENKDEIIDYYHSIGMSLALFFCLNGTDFHFENIICANKKPYFIDMECVFTSSTNLNLISHSVLSTFIIPTLQGTMLDSVVCGIGTEAVKLHNETIEISEDNNIYHKESMLEINNKVNAPVSNGVELNENIVTAINNGFDKMIVLLRERKVIQNLLKTINTLKGRMLFRSTRLYADIISVSEHPAYSCSPMLRNVYIACALYQENIPIEIIRNEYLSMIEGRIPVFHVDLINQVYYAQNGEKIDTAEKTITRKDFISKVFRITNNKDEAILQKNLIAISLQTLLPDCNHDEKKEADIDSVIDLIMTKSCSYNNNHIYLNLKRENNGSRAISVMRRDLYSGLGGAAFLQLCKLISERTTFNEVKFETIYRIVSDVNSKESVGYFGCFNSDMGGMLYLEYLIIKHVPGMINDTIFYNRLYKIMHLIINQDVANSDIIGGMASILIVCCRMHELSPSKHSEVAIRILTKKLLSQATELIENTVTWDRGWTGLSHGNSGITYALTLANNVLNINTIDVMIVKSLRYEEAFQIDSGWNGVDIYDTDKDYNSWCHGAPGIYMSRVAMLNETKRKNLEIKDILISDISHYQKTQVNREVNEHHSLCHGIYGNALIDPDRYGTHFDVSGLKLGPLEEKSLMLGKIGAVYTNYYFKHADKKIPNILMLE